MPNIEEHARFCIKVFGELNSELCYAVNSWIDAPVRSSGIGHRKERHDKIWAPVQACQIYGDVDENKEIPGTPKNVLIAGIVIQHLYLDGIVTPGEMRNWTWEEMVRRAREEQIAVERRKREVQIFHERMVERMKKSREMSAKYYMACLVFCVGFILLGLYGVAQGNPLSLWAGIFMIIISGFLLITILGILLGEHT